MARTKSAREIATNLALTPKTTKKRRKATAGFRSCMSETKGAKDVIRKFAELKRDVDMATIGAIASSQSVFGGGRGFKKRSKKGAAKMAGPGAAKMTSKRGKRKTA